MREWLARLIDWCRRRHLDAELVDELRFHQAQLERDASAAGAPAPEAVWAARRRLGNVTRIRETARERWSLPWLDHLLRDVRYGFRTLRRSPGFALGVALTLALGIGANTAIFSVVNHQLLHPLPYADADRMVFLWETATQGTYRLRVTPTAEVIGAWKKQARSLGGIEAYSAHAFLETGGHEARAVNGLAITPGLPAFLGAHSILGRVFVSADAEPGAPPVALIGEATWRRDYGSSPSVLGRVITLDGTAYTIVGVMPARWDVLDGASAAEQLWLPLSLTPANDTTWMDRANPVARLRAGVTPEEARRELNAIAARLPGGTVFGGMKFAATVLRPQRTLNGISRTALLVMLAAVGLVQLIACANVAHLLLARRIARAREIALRTALGSGRWRLARAALTETVILSLVGGAVGVVFAWYGLHLIGTLRPSRLSGLATVRLDPFVLEFTLALAILTGLLLGIVPAMQTTSPDHGSALRSGASGVVRAGIGGRVRTILVAGEMALSVVLLVAAFLLIRSVIHLQRIDVGFDPHNLFTVEMALPRGGYAQPATREPLAARVLSEIRRIPGVTGATQALNRPAHYGFTFGSIRVAGRTLRNAGEQAPVAMNAVAPSYFHTLGIRLLHGRTFNRGEMRTGRAVIINETMARRDWPNVPAVGRELGFGSHARHWSTVVGVVADVAANGLTDDIHHPQLYIPYREADAPVSPDVPPHLLFVVRAKADPSPVIAHIRQLTRAIDPDIALSDVSFVQTGLENSIAGPRFAMALLTCFAVLALALAAVGLAAVVGYAVTERSHEIGIRMALGAQDAKLLREIVSPGMRAVIAGLVLGLFGALAATRLLSSMLYGVAPHDPIAFLGVAVVLLLVAMAAMWLPARRATRVDPMIALRGE